MPTELLICVLSSEFPLDSASKGISCELPDIDFALERPRIGNASIQALTAEDADLDLRHVQPARVLGGVVELDPAQQRGGRPLAQHVLERLPEVDVQVVQDQMHATSLAVGVRQQFVDEGDEVRLASALGHRHGSLAGFGLHRHEQVGRPLAHVLVVDFGGGVGRHRQRRSAVGQQLQALLVDADDRFVHALAE